eukprot:GEMP01022860.1.p1 GENE.GEMP01022860.1~~GEMP01022860.1.p1  ORF type:complete len:537 (+),score=157.62 GEMP01022860.1:37-1611(+)
MDSAPFRRAVEKILVRDICDTRDAVLSKVREGSRLDVRAQLHQLVQTTINQCWQMALLGPGSLRVALPSHDSTTAHERFLSSTGAYLKDICQLRYRENLGEGKDLDDVCMYAPLLHFTAKQQEVMRQVIDERLRSLRGRQVVKKGGKAVERDEIPDNASGALQLEKHLRNIAESCRIKAEERSEELQAELESLQDIVASAAAEKEHMMTEMDELRTELKTTAAALLEEQAEVARRGGLRDLAAEELKHAAELAEDQDLYYRSQIELLHEQLHVNAESSEATIAAHEANERSAALKIAALTQELASAKQELEQPQRRRSSIKCETRTEEDQETKEIERLRTEVAEKDMELETLRALLGDKEGDNLQAEVENLRQGGKTMKENVEKLKVEVERLTCIIKDLEEDKEWFADAVQRLIRFERRRSERSLYLAGEFSKVMHKPLANVLNLTNHVYDSGAASARAAFEHRAKPCAQVNFNSAAMYMESNSLRRLPSAMRQRTVQGRVRPASAPIRHSPSAPALRTNVLGF